MKYKHSYMVTRCIHGSSMRLTAHNELTLLYRSDHAVSQLRLVVYLSVIKSLTNRSRDTSVDDIVDYVIRRMSDRT